MLDKELVDGISGKVIIVLCATVTNLNYFEDHLSHIYKLYNSFQCMFKGSNSVPP